MCFKVSFNHPKHPKFCFCVVVNFRLKYSLMEGEWGSQESYRTHQTQKASPLGVERRFFMRFFSIPAARKFHMESAFELSCILGFYCTATPIKENV